MQDKHCVMDLWGFAIWAGTEVPVALLRDVLLVLLNIPLILLELARIVLEIPYAKPSSELYLHDPQNVWSLTKQIGFVLLSVSPLWWLIWGYRLLMVSLQNLLRLLPRKWGAWPQQTEVAYKGDRRKSNETLNFFVNGICVDAHWLKLNCKTLEDHLGERVVGIHNQSFGLIIDLVECLLQRDLRFYTESVIQAAHCVREALRSGARVRLIGHSQGGIIVSLVVDYLVYYYPELTANLEVYTFASAADKFPAIPPPNQNITIKHYGNQFDLVAILGVLGCRLFYTYIKAPSRRLWGEHADPDVDPRYWGKIFQRPNGFGHLLSTDYVFTKPSPYVPLNGGVPSPF